MARTILKINIPKQSKQPVRPSRPAKPITITTSVSYNVCPITGISSSIKDELGSYWHEASHPIVANPEALFIKVERYSHTLSNTVIAAAILLQLHQEDLIAVPAQEAKYLRGKANDMLASFSRTKLVELYWDVRNTQAAIMASPLRFNLQSAVEQGRHTVYANIKSVGCQTVAAADMETYIRSKGIQGKLSLPSRRQDLSIKGCLKRVKKDLPILTKDLLGLTEETEDFRTVLKYSWTDLSTDKDGIARIRHILWNDSTGTTYHYLPKATQQRLVAILKAIYSRAVWEGLLDEESVAVKSYKQIVLHIEQDAIPAAAEVEL